MSRPDTPEIKSCGDGGCIFGHPGGMHTNGGCICLRDIRPAGARLRLLRNINALRNEIKRLRDFIGACHGD